MKRNLSNKYIRNSIQQQQEKNTHTKKQATFFLYQLNQICNQNVKQR